MKTTNRNLKAIVVIVIIGLGLLHNMENKSILVQSFSQATEEWENSAETDTVKTSENKLFVYTRSIIKTSIQHLISNL
jgi:hypothetical protein